MRLMGKFCSRTPHDRHQISDQIFTHLTRVFSSTASYSSFNQAFGLINYNGELLSEPLVEQIKEDIKRVVRCWETRFLLEEVEFMMQANKPHFSLQGKVDNEACIFNFYLTHR